MEGDQSQAIPGEQGGGSLPLGCCWQMQDGQVGGRGQEGDQWGKSKLDYF